MRKVLIEDFGPLSHVELQFDNQLHIIIGPQASGKSTIAKVVYFCRKIRDYLADYVRQVVSNRNLQEEFYINFYKFLRKPFMGYFGTTKHMHPFHIKYYYDVDSEKYVEISLGMDHFAMFKFSSPLKKDIMTLIDDAVHVMANVSDSFTEAFFQEIHFYESVKRQTSKIFVDDEKLIYIPAGRNLLATIPDLIQANFDTSPQMLQSVDISQIDLITQEFIQYIRQMRNAFGSKLDEITINYLKTEKGQIRNRDVELACGLIKKILKAEYIYDKEGEKLFYDNKNWVKLMFGSSGQQEVLWALNIIFLAILKNEKTFLVFEEPESHIFPDAQVLIAQLVALMINSCQSSVFLTTHSPYMLTAFNLLIYSGKIENNNVTAIVERQYRLRENSVAAYLIPDSKAELQNLISKKRHLINALEIDHISDVINEKMDSLLQLAIKSEKGGNR